jgi:hypothetical protein
MSCGKYSVAYWTDLLSQNSQGLDVGKLSAWIAEESNGCPSAIGQPTEVGIFQLNLADGPAWGGTLQSLHGDFSVSPNSGALARELTSDEELLQVTSGVAFVQHAQQFAQSNLDANNLAWSSDDTWCLTKLYHALPRLSDQYLAAAANAGQASSWSDFASYLRNISQSDAAQVNSAVANNKYYYPFGRFVDNAEAVGYAGSLSGFVAGDTLIVLAVLAAIAFLLSQHAH